MTELHAESLIEWDGWPREAGNYKGWRITREEVGYLDMIIDGVCQRGCMWFGRKDGQVIEVGDLADMVAEIDSRKSKVPS